MRCTEDETIRVINEQLKTLGIHHASHDKTSYAAESKSYTSVSASLLATNLEHKCSIGRHIPGIIQPPSAPSSVTKFAARYGKNLFSKSLDNPVITRTVTVPRVI